MKRNKTGKNGGKNPPKTPKKSDNMSKIQISALITPEEEQILCKIAQEEKTSKSQIIGTAITNYKTIKRIIEQEEQKRTTEPQVRNYENNKNT